MSDVAPAPIPNRPLIAVGVMTGMFLAALEATVVGTAMPTIVASLGGLAHYSWVFSAYLLTSTVSVPVWGKLSDIFGRRLLYQIGVFVFLAGSVVCGFATTMTQLIWARAFQGLGAGALVPMAMTIVGDIYTLRERARMQGLFSGVWGVSSIIGPLVGGFITDRLSWPWVFFINLPFGLASAAIIGFAMPKKERKEKPSIDYLGAAVLTAAVTILMLVLVEGGTMAALLRPRNLVLGVLVVALLGWFLQIERKAKDPVVPLELFRNRVVAVSVIVGFLGGVSMFGVITFVPLLAQGVLGTTATEAGSFLTPLMLSWVVASVIGGRLLIRTGYRPIVVTGLLGMVIGFAALAWITAVPSRTIMFAVLIVAGTGLGFTMLTLIIASQHSVPREQLGITTSLNQFSRSIGGALGVALLGALMSQGLAVNLLRAADQPGSGITHAEAARLSENPNALVERNTGIAARTLTALRSSLADALRVVFLVCAATSLFALVAAFFLPAGRPPATPPRPVLEEQGERMVVAEMTTLDAGSEPAAD